MKFYDKRGFQTDSNQQFGKEIREAIEPIIKKYLGAHKIFIRDLSHEAQGIVRDIELDHLMDIELNGE